MVAEVVPLDKISNFTLILFESSGWYQVNYSYAAPLTWGQGKGCSFIYGDCINRTTYASNFEEFCDDFSENCSQDRRFKSQCNVAKGTPKNPAFNYGNGLKLLDTFSDNCPTEK